MPKDSLKIGILAAVVALVVVIGVFVFFPAKSALAGSTGFGISHTNGLSVTSGVFYLGGDGSSAYPTVGILNQSSIGTCATTATSTAFDVPNPTGATSTATVLIMTSQGQATSTALNVGTTTLASGLTSTSPGQSLMAGAVIATSSQATIVSGQSTMLGTGQVSAGAGTVKTIAVGPNESIGGYATSTYGGVGALNYTPGLACTYKIKWEN